MATITELGTPGAEHAFLNDTIGTFDASMQMWFAPGAEPTVTAGRMVNRWILDGRFIQGDYTGEFGEQPFNGLCLTGYDKALGVYVGTWADSMSTMLLPISAGKRDGSAIVFEREMLDMMTGALGKTREVFTVESADRHTFEVYSVFADGSEMKTMEIVYTRAK